MDAQERFRLQLLLSRVQQLSDEHWHILVPPLRAMGDKTWVGPSARTFDRHLDETNHDLQVQLRKAVELIQSRLQSSPPFLP